MLDAARRLAEGLDLPRRLEPFDPHRWSGDEATPQLQLDDVSGIPFLEGISGVSEYQHRARLRARGGDLLVTTTPQRPGEEDYYRDRLDLGATTAILAEARERPLELAAACRRRPVLESLARRAATDGALVVHPFMGIEAVWELAAALARESGAVIEVLASPPPVTWIANDKGVFCDLVTAVLGADWVTPERRSRQPRELARGLLELAESAPRVALKRMRCASAMGNRVFASDELRAVAFEGTLERVERFLQETRWSDSEEVQAVAWEDTDLSPSTQWWIPPLGTEALDPISGRADAAQLQAPAARRAGAAMEPDLADPDRLLGLGMPPLAGADRPRLDGIYEQILVGPGKVFAGSHPSALPAAVHRELAESGAAIASALQLLGYVGRCSFDHLVLGDPTADHVLRFTECNGRWGGTSTPMHLVDRLLGRPADRDPDDPAPRRRPYQAMDVVHPSLVGLSFREVLRRAGDRAFERSSGEGDLLFYNVGPLERHGKLDVVALGSSREEAASLLTDELPRILGL